MTSTERHFQWADRKAVADIKANRNQWKIRQLYKHRQTDEAFVGQRGEEARRYAD